MNGLKIVFLCGSLEPGRDGVGDYTRRLAAELKAAGHEVMLIALFDKFSENVVDGSLNANDINILRIPNSWENSQRLGYVKNKIKTFKPDWISIQFVIYNYHPKGVPRGLPNLFRSLTRNVKTHIMFHELWIGISEFSPFKHKVWGYLQKKIITSIIKTVQPKVVSTSNILYQFILKQANADAGILPLFSNIEVAPKNQTLLSGIINKLGLSSEKEISKWNIIGTFGKLHPDTKLEPILKEQLAISQTQKLKTAFISFGKIDAEGMVEFNRLENVLSPDIKFLLLGEQSPDDVSNIMQLLNIGISCTPLHYIGKSGVYAAMKLHDVNVIIPEESMFPQYDNEIKEYVSQFVINKGPEHWSASNVALSYVNLLSAH